MLDGRYRLMRLLGQGGMAEVWEAHDTQDDREVAVKVVRPARDLVGHWFDTEDMHQGRTELHGRFRREGEVLAGLRHPGIPELYGRGTHGDRPYIAMRLVKGKSLYRFLETQWPFARSVVIAIAYQVADALACAHAAQLVHRDLKPHNVVIDRDGTVVLIDFGIALPLRPGVTRYTEQGKSVGSKGYMAPEQIREERLTLHTDLYAYGCVTFELCTGRQPFGTETGLSIVRQHLESVPPSVQEFAPWVPDDIAELILRLLAKDPGERPPDVQAVLKVLKPHLPVLGETAPDPRVDPDPTLRFREPAGSPAGAVHRPPVVSRAARPRRAATWVSRRNVEEVLVEVNGELAEGRAGPATECLAEILPAARREFGADPLVLRARRTCADSLRIVGDCVRAGDLYQQQADDLGRASDPAVRAERLVALLRVAECRIPSEEIDAALDILRDVVSEVVALPAELAEPVVVLCEELGVELSELRRETEVNEILAPIRRRRS
ncbi:serine/threonine protein kinase PkaE [Streptosporangium oxazolinicum]|uniref:non-specific serine/threonine protein kinase n=2 Tax=Streptosporangium oxazolinicum TaxID=909287 RepID=A0ABP8AQL8_9ACTN